MAQFCIEIKDEDVSRVITAVCDNYGYNSTIENPNFDPENGEDPVNNPQTITNPETQFQFANRMARNFLMEHTISYETKMAQQQLANPVPPEISDPAV
tara:strand:- start:218 stop:511 length:294 start_codon:yes stop_codon:yes gene_type:complete